MAAKTGLLVLVLALLQLSTSSVAWDTDGHTIICNLARPLMTSATMAEVNNLMNSQFQHNFSTLCTWGEEMQYLPPYSWSPPLHYINTPDQLCSYDSNRDCVGIFGEPNFCASGAIKNYTSQLVDPNSPYNRTESLLFLANIMGDIHQPLRVGFSGDGGGSFIRVWWLNTLNGSNTDLFSVWDSGIVHEAYERYYNQSNPTFNETLVDILGNMSLSVYSNLTAEEVAAWSPCPAGPAACPDMYAAESIQLACQYAYADVLAAQILTEKYFYTRLPIVEQRLVQAGVRLAATLNRIFDPTYISPPLASAPAPAIPTPAAPAPNVNPLPSNSSPAPALPLPAPVIPTPAAPAPIAPPLPSNSSPTPAFGPPAPVIPTPAAPAPIAPLPSNSSPAPALGPPAPVIPNPTAPAPITPPLRSNSSPAPALPPPAPVIPTPAAPAPIAPPLPSNSSPAPVMTPPAPVILNPSAPVIPTPVTPVPIAPPIHSNSTPGPAISPPASVIPTPAVPPPPSNSSPGPVSVADPPPTPLPPALGSPAIAPQPPIGSG